MATSKASKRQAVKVYLTPEELQTIQQRAQSVNLEPSPYLRRMGLGEPLTNSPVVDMGNEDLRQAVELISTLFHINGDLGRVGGLFKMWLTGHDQLRVPVPEGEQRADVEQCLAAFGRVRERLADAIDEFRKCLHT